VKRFCRDEPLRVAIHMCMEAMLGISLYSSLFLKLAKIVCFLFIFYGFCSTKSENKGAVQVLPRGRGRVRRKVAQIMYMHVGKCKNNKIKLKKQSQ
jgi:hypothetical protein